MLRRGTENHSKVSRIRLKGDPAPNFGTFQMDIYFMSSRMGVSSGRFQLFFLFFSNNLRVHIDEDYRLEQNIIQTISTMHIGWLRQGVHSFPKNWPDLKEGQNVDFRALIEMLESQRLRKVPWLSPYLYGLRLSKLWGWSTYALNAFLKYSWNLPHEDEPIIV